MTSGAITSRLGAFSAGEIFRRYATDPIRLLTVVMTAVVLGYGARVDNHSPFTVWFLESLVGASLTGIEVILILILLFELVRRLILGDAWVNRSPVTRPVIWVGVMLGLVPFFRMMISEGRFRFPLEMLELPGVVMGFFIWLLVYRREDLQLMVWLVLIAGLFKSLEGVSIFLSVGLGWGLLTGWRDAMLMAITVLAAFFAFTIKPEGDRAYQRIRIFLFCLLPMALFTYIGSTRRSFVLGASAAILVLIFKFPKRERKRLLIVALPMVLVLGVGAVALIGSSQFVDRLGVIGDPGQEGSATYRLLEVYNISGMIAERPIFGWPFGVPWENDTHLELPIVSPVVPHNTYLHAAWRGGMIGLAIWLWLMVAMLRMHFRTIRAARAPFERFLAFWLTSATIAVIVAGFTMPIGSDRLKWFYPFLMVMTSYLPGAWPERRQRPSPPELA